MPDQYQPHTINFVISFLLAKALFGVLSVHGLYMPACCQADTQRGTVTSGGYTGHDTNCMLASKLVCHGCAQKVGALWRNGNLVVHCIQTEGSGTCFVLSA